MARTVLVTGVSRYVGGRVAEALGADPSISRVLGVDVIAPATAIDGVEFVRADIRNPVIAKVLGEEAVDTVVHAGSIATSRQAGSRSTMKEINVIGTMQLLAACQRAPGVQRLVVKSTGAVYGAGPRDPAKFSEDMDPRDAPTSGWAKDSVEVEGYVRGFARRRPDVAVTTLRLANILGPRITTGMTSYFRMRVVPTVLGFDPRLVFVHEDDAVAALCASVHSPAHGVFNIAGDGNVVLSQALRRLGRASVAVPAFVLPTVGRTLGPSRHADFTPEVVRLLTFGRGLDTTAMREVLGFSPAFTTEQALASLQEPGHDDTAAGEG